MIVQRRLVTCVAALAFGATAPAVAEGATLNNAGGTLTFVGNGDTVNSIDFTQTAGETTVDVSTVVGDNDPITATGCDGSGASFTCENVTALVVDAAGSNDDVSISGFSGAITLSGGTGDDFLSVSGGSGAATINGGDGDDFLSIRVLNGEPRG